jgi:hypothetical protein
MSLITVPEFYFPDLPSTVSAAPTVAGAATLDLNGASQWVAFVFSCPKTVTVDSVFFRVNSATTGCTATVRIETVDTATGLPSGNLPHANATTTVSIASGAANYEVTFPGTFTLTKGTLYAIYIGAPTSVTTPSAILFSTFSDDGGDIGMPYALDFDASASYRDTLCPSMAIGTTGSSSFYIEKLWPITAAAMDSFASTSSPDTIGNKITIKAPLRVCGAWAWLDLDEGANVKLYNTDGSTVLGSGIAYPNVPPSTAQLINVFQFSSPVELATGDYYLAVEATTTTNIGIGSITFSDARWRSASPIGGADFCYTSCTQTPTSTGSWTTTPTKQAFIGLIVDGIEGGGGGETSHVFIG